MNSTFSVFSPQQWQVLRALCQYRFLTVDQMLRLGISKNAKSLRDKTLFALRHHGCIHSEKIGSFLPDIHHLTQHGANILSQLEPWDEVTPPSNKRTPFSALFAQHRFGQVDFHIGLSQWVASRGDVEILLALQDFVRRSGKEGKPAKSVTEMKVPTLNKAVIPDGVFAINAYTGRIAVYLIEIHRSTQTKAVTEQLAHYFEIIKNAAVQETFGYPVHPIICSVHHQPSVLAKVKKRLLELQEFQSFKRNFVFHTLADLSDNFSTGWHFADGSVAQPFPLPKPIQNAC